ncbi:MAG TPA: NUDIX hydrolase [Patescibacteria group bacterium]|nr:NUDIX hydrolase [Patescibacteria group bacterium]
MNIQRPAAKQPLPPHAKLAFKGVMFDVYQWEQEGFDGTTMVFEKIKRPDTVVVLAVTPEKKILTATQEQPGKPPFTGLLGGRVDEGEAPLEAAKRELLEESGYASEDWELLHAYQPITKIDWAIFVFIARNVKKVADQTLDSGEKIELKLTSFDELVELSLHDPTFAEKDVVDLILRALLEPQKMQELRDKILG